MTGQYLPADALHLLGKLYRTHQFLMLMAGLLLWVAVTSLLRSRVHRWGFDTIFFAFFVTVVSIFIAACLYLLSRHPGYHFLLS